MAHAKKSIEDIAKDTKPSRLLAIKEAFAKSFSDIKANPFIFLVLLLSQTVFVITTAFVYSYFVTKILDALRTINMSIPTMASQDSIKVIVESNTLLSKYLLFGFISILLVYLVINGMNWELSTLMSQRKFSYFKFLRKYVFYSSFFILPAFVLIVIVLSMLIALNAVAAFIVSALIILFFGYFLYLALAIIDDYDTTEMNIRRHLHKAVKMGLNNVILLLLAYLIIYLPLAGVFVLLGLYAETTHIALLVLLIALPVILLVIGRLFFINLVRKLS